MADIHSKTLDLKNSGNIAQQAPLSLSLLEARISAGFPSSAENYLSQSLDLNDLLIKHPAATFFIRVIGDSMIGAGIHSGDIVIVDRSLTPVHNRIVIARIDNELTIKRISFEDNKITLFAENPTYKPLIIHEGMDFEIWGTVTFVIHKV
jgi:DNA polymerase V